MLRESENNDVHFTAPSWKSGTGSQESRFSFARQDNQGNLLDSSLRNCGTGTEQNFSLLPQNSRGNIYQNGLAFQSLENDFSNSNSLGVLDMPTAGEYYDTFSPLCLTEQNDRYCKSQKKEKKKNDRYCN
jgi:CCR4-NOT transcription complex subunit 4